MSRRTNVRRRVLALVPRQFVEPPRVQRQRHCVAPLLVLAQAQRLLFESQLVPEPARVLRRSPWSSPAPPELSSARAPRRGCSWSLQCWCPWCVCKWSILQVWSTRAVRRLRTVARHSSCRRVSLTPMSPLPFCFSLCILLRACVRAILSGGWCDGVYRTLHVRYDRRVPISLVVIFFEVSLTDWSILPIIGQSVVDRAFEATHGLLSFIPNIHQS